MVLKDAFSAVLIIARELSGDPAVKQAISDDIALLESKAVDGIDSLEAHVGAWFGKHYALPVPVPVTATVPVPAPAAAAPAYAAPAEAVVPAEADPAAADVIPVY